MACYVFLLDDQIAWHGRPLNRRERKMPVADVPTHSTVSSRTATPIVRRGPQGTLSTEIGQSMFYSKVYLSPICFGRKHVFPCTFWGTKCYFARFGLKCCCVRRSGGHEASMSARGTTMRHHKQISKMVERAANGRWSWVFSVQLMWFLRGFFQTR